MSNIQPMVTTLNVDMDKYRYGLFYMQSLIDVDRVQLTFPCFVLLFELIGLHQKLLIYLVWEV